MEMLPDGSHLHADGKICPNECDYCMSELFSRQDADIVWDCPVHGPRKLPGKLLMAEKVEDVGHRFADMAALLIEVARADTFVEMGAVRNKVIEALKDGLLPQPIDPKTEVGQRIERVTNYVEGNRGEARYAKNPNLIDLNSVMAEIDQILAKPKTEKEDGDQN